MFANKDDADAFEQMHYTWRTFIKDGLQFTAIWKIKAAKWDEVFRPESARGMQAKFNISRDGIVLDLNSSRVTDTVVYTRQKLGSKKYII